MTRDADGATPSAVSGDPAVTALRLRDRYRVLSEVGRGLFGSVYVGLDEVTGQRVAVRHLLDKGAGKTIGRSGVITASRLDPGLVRVLDAGLGDDGGFFTVTKLAEGRPLSEILSGSPLPFDVAIRIALQLGAAVEALHDVGLVHGALRPHNVRVLADGRVSLMDVEIVGLRKPDGGENAPPEYLAPEQFHGRPLTEKTDVYALGVIIYEMLCGSPPFQGVTRDAVRAAQLAARPRLRRRREAIPAPIRRAVAKALDQDPQRRLLMSELRNHLADGLVLPAVSPIKRAAAVGAIAVAATVGVFVAWTTIVSHTTRRTVPPPRPIAVEPAVPLPRPSAAEPAAQPFEPAMRATPAPARMTPTPAPVTSIRPPTPPRPNAATPLRPSGSTPSRRENPPPSAADREPAPTRPSPASDDSDPAAVIDWLLKRSASRPE